MIGVVYFLVIIAANTLGAISGMGGGVIIKPVLDFIGYHPVISVSFYSTAAVFTMSIASTIRQVKSGPKFRWKMIVWISISAILGGVLGNIVFEQLLTHLSDDSFVTEIQIIITVISLAFAFLYMKFNWKSWQLNHRFYYVICGFSLGFLASLLGIGGGPINVAFMMLMFGIDIKEATVYSICTIFFSQFAKLITISFSSGFGEHDLSILFFIVPAAILGGTIGAKLNQKMPPERVKLIFQWVIMLVIVINVFNFFNS